MVVDPLAPFAREGLSQAPVLRLSVLQLHPSLGVVMPVMGDTPLSLGVWLPCGMHCCWVPWWKLKV